MPNKIIPLIVFGLVLAIVAISTREILADEVVVEGAVGFDDLRKGKTDILLDLPKEEAEKYKKYALSITMKDDQYFWASNGNKRLVRIEMPVVEWHNNQMKYITFINPDGYGQIFIRDDSGKESEYCNDVSHINSFNYTEYRLNEKGSGFDVYSGYTKPFPYPVPAGEKCPW